MNFDLNNVSFEGKIEHTINAASLKLCEEKRLSPIKMKGKNHLFSCSMYSLFPNSHRWNYNMKTNINQSYHTKQMHDQEDRWNGRVCQKFILQHKLPLILYSGKKRMLIVLVTFLGGLSAVNMIINGYFSWKC